MPEQTFKSGKAYSALFRSVETVFALIRNWILPLVLFFFPSLAFSAGEGERMLVIGTKQAPPFSMKNAEGTWEGIGVELWNKIALDNGFSFEFRESELADLLEKVAAEKLDACVAAITVTADREHLVDFSQPFFLSGLAIAVREKGSSWGRVVQVFFSSGFLRIVTLLSLVLLVSGFLVWFFERVKNPEQFGGTPAQGIGAGFWWAAVTMTTGGYGDKAPKTIRTSAFPSVFSKAILIASPPAPKESSR